MSHEINQYKMLVIILLSLVTRVATTTPGNHSDKYLPLVNRPLQAVLLSVILTTAIVFNGAVIINISRDLLKTRICHFVLIRHVCIADFVGAMVVLPVPLVAVVKGTWDVSDSSCCIISITTASVWTMHLVAMAFYRADRMAAVWLSTGRYPLVRIRTLNVLLVTTWFTVITLATLATFTFGVAYQPTLALCIPNVPLIFFITVFTGYITGLVALTTVYLISFLRRRKKKNNNNKYTIAIRSNSMETLPNIKQPHHRRCHSDESNQIQQSMPISKYLSKPHNNRRTGDMATRAVYSYSISLGHLFLYLPSIMIVGLVKATSLPRIVALICGLVVYCEFIIQPAALVVLSPRLRGEVFF